MNLFRRLCTDEKWQKARAMVEMSPDFLRKHDKETDVRLPEAIVNNPELIQLVYKTVQKSDVKNKKKWLKHLFEGKYNNGDTLVSYAIFCGQLKSLTLLIQKCCPSRKEMLTVDHGFYVQYCVRQFDGTGFAAGDRADVAECMDYAIANSALGPRLLTLEWKPGIYPLRQFLYYVKCETLEFEKIAEKLAQWLEKYPELRNYLLDEQIAMLAPALSNQEACAIARARSSELNFANLVLSILEQESERKRFI